MLKEQIIVLHEYLVDLISLSDLTEAAESEALEVLGLCEMLLFYGNWPLALGKPQVVLPGKAGTARISRARAASSNERSGNDF
jgi:hypothetical protein